MMMKALEEGGMDAVYRQSRDVMKNRFADEQYDPNIGGLYELEKRDYRALDFPRGYEGKLIKALNLAIPRMNVMPDGIRVVFMRRDPEEIRQSYLAFFNRNLSNVEKLNQNMENVLACIRNRRDVLSLDIFWYRKVIEEPLRHFQSLMDHGWPVDPSLAAGVVDPQYCRYRIEGLELGVL